MAKLNMKDALEQALLATKAYIDDNHYNQTEVDALLDTKSDEGHTHDYLPLSGGTIESAEFAPLKIKNAGSDSLLLDTTTDDLGQSSNYYFQLPYTLDIKVGETYTLVSGDRTVTAVCKTGPDNDIMLEFWNAGSGIDIAIRANYNGSKGAYEKNTTYVIHMYNPVPDFKLYAPSTGDTTSGPAISFENGDDPLGHLCIEERNGSFLRYNSDASSSYTIIDEENYPNIINCESIGAAPAEHGTHVTYATVAGKANGTAAVGTSSKVAREDHVHPLQTSVSGNAGSANKVNKSLVIKINGGTTEGTNMFTFDGSGAKTINLKASDLGAPTSHNHDDRYYTETEINNKITQINTDMNNAFDGVNDGIAAEEERALAAEAALQTAIDNETKRAKDAEAKALTDAKTYADAKVAGILDSAPETLNTLNELAAALGDDPNFATTIMTEIGKKANSQHGTHVTYDDTNKPKAAGTAACGTSAKVARADHVHPVQTSVSGNAGSANKVNNALSIQLNGGTATSFDGSAAKSINITPASIGAAAAHNHDAYINKNAFANIKVGKTTVAADAVQDTVELVAGSNITITPDATNDKITIAATDTVYTHPSYTAKVSGFYKVTVDASGHVSATTAVTKSDITGLGIPGQDTVYTHPTHTAYNSGLYKVTVNNLGHVTAATAVAKSDITALGIPGSDTNTWRGVQDNLTSTAKDQSLSANQGKILKGLVDNKADITVVNNKADMIEDTALSAMLTKIFGTAAASLDE